MSDGREFRFEAGQHMVVLGRTGSGKTYWIRETLIPTWRRAIVVDTEQMDYERLPAVSLRSALRYAKGDKAFHVRVLARGDHSEADLAMIDDLCYGLLEVGHDVLVVFDEATDFSDAHRIPESLRGLVRKARKRNISTVMGTQRPAMLSKDAYTQASHLVIFYLSDYDTDAIKEYAPWVKEHISQIPYGSYRFLYQGPDGTVTVLQSAR